MDDTLSGQGKAFQNNNGFLMELVSVLEDN